MTTPVADFQVVSAKFAAAFLFYVVMWLPSLACLFIVAHFADQAGALDPGTIGGMYLGVFLAGAFFLSFGCLASALTRSQMVASVISIAFGVSQFTLAYWAKNHPVGDNWQSQLWSSLNLFDRMTDMARGDVDTRALTFYFSMTFLFLFLTLRVLESRRWR